MDQTYNTVAPEDFMKIGGARPSHLLIEDALVKLGGGGANGGSFKKEVLKLAGWNGGPLTTYASRSQLAAEAFNTIRNALDSSPTADELKSKLTH